MHLNTDIEVNPFRNRYPENASQEITEGFLLLELAFRLQAGFRVGLIDQVCFTQEITLDTGTGTTISAREFDVQALEPRFHNLVLSTMTTLVIAIDRALDKHYGAKHPDKCDNINSLRNVFYMLRCALAHDVINPAWGVKGKYGKVYSIIIPKEIMQKITENKFHSDKILTYDFSILNDKRVSYYSFYGIDGLIACTLYAFSLCESSVERSGLSK